MLAGKKHLNVRYKVYMSIFCKIKSKIRKKRHVAAPLEVSPLLEVSSEKNMLLQFWKIHKKNIWRAPTLVSTPDGALDVKLFT